MSLPFEGVLALRRRSSWEAADAGLLLWRENFIYFLPFFAMPFWICAFALRLLPGNIQYLSWLLLWWLKPLFDRTVLHIISVRFLEKGANIKRICRGLGRSLRRGLCGDLLWRRFSPLRAAMMPVRVLESSAKRGKAAQRRKILKRGGLGFCALLSFWGIALEITLLIGELLFFMIMAELIRSGFVSSLGDSIKNAEIYIFAAWCFNYMLVESLYVCMGFSLYTNSRIEVEGWDIEIMFRGLAEKFRSKSIACALLVLCLTVGLFFPPKAIAGEWKPASAPEDIPLEQLQNILDSPDFGGEKDSWGIRLKNPMQPKEIPDFNLNPNLEKMRQIFAFILRFFLIAAISALIVFLLFFIRKFSRGGKAEKDTPSMKALSGKSEEGPESLLDKAAGFFDRGDMRLAWGYCVAAAVKSWSLYRGIAFPPNATENDCAELVNAASKGDEARAFDELIKNWVNLAYAGRFPPDGSFQAAAAFCKTLRPANE